MANYKILYLIKDTQVTKQTFINGLAEEFYCDTIEVCDGIYMNVANYDKATKKVNNCCRNHRSTIFENFGSIIFNRR